MTDGDRHVVIGAGPAGLTAAWELSRRGCDVVVLEADDTYVGGLSRTQVYRGNRSTSAVTASTRRARASPSWSPPRSRACTARRTGATAATTFAVSPTCSRTASPDCSPSDGSRPQGSPPAENPSGGEAGLPGWAEGGERQALWHSFWHSDDVTRSRPVLCRSLPARAARRQRLREGQLQGDMRGGISGSSEDISVRLDRARQHLEAKKAIVGDVFDPGNTRIGIVVTDDRMTADGQLETLTHVRSPSPETTVVGHVHEVDGDVVDLSSAHGRGVRRSLKPDLAAAGGRQLYSATFGNAQPMVEPSRATAVPPGVAVAAPPDRQAHATGTTFAAIEVSRRAVQIADSLQALGQIDDAHLAIATKALLVHGTSFAEDQLLVVPIDRLMGHGPLERDLAAGCLPSQATLMFTGDLHGRERVDLEVPFPQAVGGLSTIKRVTTTLAWFSPVNWNHRQYRQAKLVVEGPNEIPAPTRTVLGPDHRLTQRGTVQHRVFETSRAFSAPQLTFPVKCTAQAGGFPGTVPFALAVTLEVGAGVGVDVYEAVRQEIRHRARVR